MASYRALIVEDSIDVRRALKAALELLLQDFQVADVPSAEEGLLDFFRQPVDLLITDFRLPGMTGFELMERMRTKKPDLKVIMVTGMPEPEYRTQALAAGADVFFYKPIEIADFIAAIRTIFSLPDAPVHPTADVEEHAPPTLGDLLAQLRQSAHAQAVFLIDSLGQPAAQAGEFRELEPNAAFVPMLVAAANASRKLSSLLGSVSPESLLYTRGNRVAFLVAPVGEELILLVVLPQPESAAAALTYAELRPVLDQLRNVLNEMGMAGVSPRYPEPEIPAGQEQTNAQVHGHDLELEAIVQAGSPGSLKTDDLNAFWEKVAVEEETPLSTNPDVLSYEEARRLGLTPDSGPAALSN